MTSKESSGVEEEDTIRYNHTARDDTLSHSLKDGPKKDKGKSKKQGGIGKGIPRGELSSMRDSAEQKDLENDMPLEYYRHTEDRFSDDDVCIQKTAVRSSDGVGGKGDLSLEESDDDDDRGGRKFNNMLIEYLYRLTKYKIYLPIYLLY